MLATTIIRQYQAGTAILAAFIGNSIGCGYYATYTTPGDCYLVEVAAGQRGATKLTPTSRIDTRVQSAAIQIRTMLKTANSSSDLLNYSGDGWDTNDHLGIYTGKGRAANEVEDTIGQIIALNPKPAVVFLPLQINDLNHQVGFATFQANTRTIVDRFITAGIVPVLVRETDHNLTYEGKTQADYVAEIDVIAAEKTVSVIDSYTPFKTAMDAHARNTVATGLYYDYAHPNQAGHDLIFAQFASWFEQPVKSELKTITGADAGTLKTISGSDAGTLKHNVNVSWQ